MGAITNEALTDLYRRRADLVYRICLTLMRNGPDAEDLTQDVFRKVLERTEPFRDPEHERAWLIVTARNVCRDQLKHWWRTRRAGAEALDHIAWEQPEDGALWELLLKLPENERLALFLHYHQGYTTEEIARLMGRKPATVRSWLYRGRQRLRPILEANGYGT